MGPGGSPFPRSNVLLEKIFNDEDALEQRGYASALKTDKPIIYFDGGRFPFEDHSFDYVICSHVLEHVEDIEFFLQELCRVAPAGYLEFPTVYYDYIYNIPKHITMLMYKEETSIINYLPKNETGLEYAKKLQEFFFRTTFKGYLSMIDDLKPLLFQGIEWHGRIEARRGISLEDLLYDLDSLNIPLYKPSLAAKAESVSRVIIGRLKSMFRSGFR